MDVVAEARVTTQRELWLEPRRARLVGLCAAITGDREAAEDLAQETLLEAWRNAHKLHDPEGADRWLAAIARNVCLRWARRRGRDAMLAPLDEEPAGVDAGLERAELAGMVERALAQLPAETREAIVRRYVHDAPHAEIGARLGISEDAVGMRLARGKAALRRILGAELEEAWHETGVWCSECGSRRLLAQRTPGVVAFRCPGCSPHAPGSELPLDNPLFARLLEGASRPTSVIGRVAEWTRGHFASGAGTEVACTRCGRAARVATYTRAARDDGSRVGLVAECGSCGDRVSSSAGAIALAQPAARRLRREQPRIRALPLREVDHGGAAAYVVRYESLLGSAGVDVLLARDSLRVLAVA
jgi:RNA polymerase sigma-70 factor (ECF subfamily)